jgi:hypothetical protein
LIAEPPACLAPQLSHVGEAAAAGSHASSPRRIFDRRDATT